MTRRLLPPEEWDRMRDDAQIGPVLEMLSPRTTMILVVEDTDGTILGSWTATRVLFAEGVHMRRSSPAVARHLWLGMREVMRDESAACVLTSADRAEVSNLLTSHGATATVFPLTTFQLPWKEGVCLQR